MVYVVKKYLYLQIFLQHIKISIMKNTLRTLFLFISTVHMLQAQVCGCSDCPTFLPDNTMDTRAIFVEQRDSHIHVANTPLVCGVKINFDHEYLGDLSIKLVSPSGESVELIGQIGLFGETDGTFWDLSFTRCDSVAAPDDGFSEDWQNNQNWGTDSYYTGTYYPYGGCLQVFDTSTVEGVWKLEIIDGQPSDVGNFLDFELIFCDSFVEYCSSIAHGFEQSISNLCESDSVQFNCLLDTTIFNQFQWTFPGGTPASSTALNPTIQYNTNGFYDVFLTAYTPTDSINYQQLDKVRVFKQPDASFSVGIIDNFVFLQGASGTKYFWNGLPFTPPYFSDTLGVVNIMSIASTPCNADTIVQSINFDLMPIADFTYSTTGASLVEFQNTSIQSDTYEWDFGNNTLSTDPNPSYLYPGPGLYTVKLKATNSIGSDLTTKVIEVKVSDTENLSLEAPNYISVLPNPTKGEFIVYGNRFARNESVTWSVNDESGRFLKAGKGTWPLEVFDFSGFKHGIYFFKVQGDHAVWTAKIVLF